MYFNFKNKKITNMISIVPNNVIKFEDEAGQYNFPINRTLKMMDIMGYKGACEKKSVNSVFYDYIFTYPAL